MSNMPTESISSVGKKVHRGKMWLRVLLICILTLVIFMLGAYGSSALIMKNGQYTVLLYEDGVSENSLSLSETSDFSAPTVRLNCPGISHMTNISANDLPAGLHDAEGSHNGMNYIAYTFYLKNLGGKADIEEKMTVGSVLLSADEAIRVRVYKNGIATTYAKLGADGMPEYGTQAFDGDTVFQFVNLGVGEGETIKYTIVIWLEGDDPECLDNIRGGAVELSMIFSIVDSERED